MTKQVSAEAREAAEELCAPPMGIELGTRAFVDYADLVIQSGIDKSRATLPSAGASARGICPKCDLPFTNLPEHMTCHREPSPPPPQPAVEGEWTADKELERDNEFYRRGLTDGRQESVARIEELERERNRKNETIGIYEQRWTDAESREADLTAALHEWKERADIRQDRIVELEAENARLALKPASALTATKEEK